MKTTSETNRFSLKYAEKLITDSGHLIDLPALETTFSDKNQSYPIKSPVVKIKVLSVFNAKNGLANLL